MLRLLILALFSLVALSLAVPQDIRLPLVIKDSVLPDTATITVGKGRLNVRSEPNVEGDNVIGSVAHGESYKVLAATADRSWIRIAVPGVVSGTGWIPVEFVIFNTPFPTLTKTPTVTPTPTTTAIPTLTSTNPAPFPCPDLQLQAPACTTTPTNTSTVTPTPSTTATSTTTGTPTSTGTSTTTPTVTPTATATEVVDATCDCSSNVYNCPNFDKQPQAQACFNYCVSQGKGDIHGLDTDDDGEACEGLPGGFTVVR